MSSIKRTKRETNEKGVVLIDPEDPVIKLQNKLLIEHKGKPPIDLWKKMIANSIPQEQQIGFEVFTTEEDGRLNDSNSPKNSNQRTTETLENYPNIPDSKLPLEVNMNELYNIKFENPRRILPPNLIDKFSNRLDRYETMAYKHLGTQKQMDDWKSIIQKQTKYFLHNASNNQNQNILSQVYAIEENLHVIMIYERLDYSFFKFISFYFLPSKNEL